MKSIHVACVAVVCCRTQFSLDGAVGAFGVLIRPVIRFTQLVTHWRGSSSLNKVLGEARRIPALQRWVGWAGISRNKLTGLHSNLVNSANIHCAFLIFVYRLWKIQFLLPAGTIFYYYFLISPAIGTDKDKKAD